MLSSSKKIDRKSQDPKFIDMKLFPLTVCSLFLGVPNILIGKSSAWLADHSPHEGSDEVATSLRLPVGICNGTAAAASTVWLQNNGMALSCPGKKKRWGSVKPGEIYK